MAQPGQSGDSDMEQALNELGDMIRKQQQLRDKTFKQGQDTRRDRSAASKGDQGMGDLQQDQQGLRDRLKKLQQELAKRGMGQAEGQKGQQGRRPAGRATGPGRRRRRRFSATPITRWATPTAGSAKAMPMARWIRKARRWMPCARARKDSREAMQQGDGDGPGRRPRQSRRPAAGRRQPDRSAGPAAAWPRIRRRFDGEDSRRDRRAAGAPDSRRTAPPPRRSRSGRRSNSITSSGC